MTLGIPDAVALVMLGIVLVLAWVVSQPFFVEKNDCLANQQLIAYARKCSGGVVCASPLSPNYTWKVFEDADN